MGRNSHALAAVVLVGLVLAGPAAAAPVPALTWLEQDGTPRFSLPLADPETAPVGELTADRWFVPLPPLAVELIDGGELSLRETGGSVLIIDFFATWCEPCREELPHFQALYEARRQDGLEAIAINVEEPTPLALQFAEEMGLTMPLGRYVPDMTPRLYGSALPTVVVADRQGRIRGRWDGYKEGYEREIADLVDRLLGGETEKIETIAPVFRSDLAMSVRWLRRTPAPVEGLIVNATEEDRPALITSLGRSLTSYESDGRTGKRRSLDRGLRRLVSADPVRPWTASLAGIRPGAETITLFDSPGGAASDLEAPSLVLDAAWFPSTPDEPTTLLALATMKGLFVRAAEAPAFEKIPGVAGVSSLVRTTDPSGELRLAALEIEGRIAWLDRSWNVVSHTPAPGGWRLIGGEHRDLGLGVAPSGVEASAVGDFAGRDEPWVALALESELWILDPRSGTIGFRAGWAGLKALACGDLDSDGIDELIVASEAGELAVLELDRQGREQNSAESALFGERNQRMAGIE